MITSKKPKDKSLISFEDFYGSTSNAASGTGTTITIGNIQEIFIKVHKLLAEAAKERYMAEAKRAETYGMLAQYLKEIIVREFERRIHTELRDNLWSFGGPSVNAIFRGPGDRSIQSAMIISDRDLTMKIGEKTDIPGGTNRHVVELVGKELANSIIDNFFTWQRIANQELNLKEILDLPNIEHRMAAIKIFGVERLIQESKAKMLASSSRGNELYKFGPEIFGRDAYFLKYICPSTGRIYISGIDPEYMEKIMKERPEKVWADTAMAWKFQLELRQYSSLKVEA